MGTDRLAPPRDVREKVSGRLAGPAVKGVVTIVTKSPPNRAESPSEQALSGSKAIPALLVDVDGVISLWGFPAGATPEGSWITVDGIVHFLSAEAGRHLLALTDGFELVWCSGWEDKANEYLPQALGLPGPFPFLTFENRTSVGGVEGSDDVGLPHWKLAAIDRWAGSRRALAWVDDAHDARTRAWAARRTGPTLLLDTEPATGLGARHVEALLAWRDAIASPHGP
jgi:hypothetical protein